MSIGILNNKVQEIEPAVVTADDTLNTSNLAIPFSMLIKKNLSPDIYNGEENIAFSDRHIEFKEILMDEFLIY